MTLRLGIHNIGVLGLTGMIGQPGTYTDKVLGYGPIAYWIQGEAAGVTAIDQVNSPAQDGAYTGVTLGQPGIGDGNTCPLYDGANDYTDAFTATLAGVFDGGEGTVALWARMANAGVWTDGTRRDFYELFVDGPNFVIVRKSTVNGQIDWLYNAGGTLEIVSLGGQTTIDWFPLAITWSASAGVNGEMRAYINGTQTGATQINLGVWAGVPGRVVIGASDLAPNNPWSGYLAHCAMWDRALTADEIAGLAVVE